MSQILPPLFFSNLLTYQEFAPAILRIAAACVFFYLAYHHFQNRENIAHTRFPVIGAHSWVAWVGALVDLLVGVALLLGAETQIAAIVGALVALKYAIWYGKYPSYFILPRSTALLLLAVCLALIFTGAGIFFAMDLPL